MGRAVTLVLAVLLVCTLPVASYSGGSPADRLQTPSNNGKPVADLENADWLGPANPTNGTGYVAIDLSATLTADAIDLQSQYAEHRVDVRLEEADSDAERRAIVREETRVLSERVTELREHERKLYRDYHEDEIGERELLIELAAVHTQAVVLERSASTLDEIGSGSDHEDRIEAIEVETATMKGPVREQIAKALRGEIDPTRVYVESDGNGVVLATIHDGYFYREAESIDARDPAGDPRLDSLGESEERINELYPEVVPTANWSYSEIGHGVHEADGTYSGGSITVYLDRTTTDVYREHLTLRLDQTDTTLLENETEDGVRLSVMGTGAGGPAAISLTDADSGASLSGDITVNDRHLGETDDEGQLWIIVTREPTTITATVGSTTIELTLGPDDLEGG